MILFPSDVTVAESVSYGVHSRGNDPFEDLKDITVRAPFNFFLVNCHIVSNSFLEQRLYLKNDPS